MTIELGPNQYGKAETRVVRITRDGDRHAIRDLNVSIALSGDMEAAHLAGDNSAVLPTDTQKNTVFAFARSHGIASAEEFAVLLARHFTGHATGTIHRARVRVEEYAWERVPVTGHSFVRAGREIRTARVTCGRTGLHIVSGVTGLTVLNSTGSEFHGFATDEYTTLAETHDRLLATAVTAEWRHAGPGPDEPGRPGADHGGHPGEREPAAVDWDASHAEVTGLLLEAFAGTHSRSLQQTLHAMGHRVLERRPDIAEVRLRLPNRHHFAVDLRPFGLDNPGEVFHAADRPYGLIEGTVRRAGLPPAEEAWWSS